MNPIIVAVIIGASVILLQQYEARAKPSQLALLGRARVVILVLAIAVFAVSAVVDPSTRYPSMLFAIVGASMLATKWRRLWFQSGTNA